MYQETLQHYLDRTASEGPNSIYGVMLQNLDRLTADLPHDEQEYEGWKRVMVGGLIGLIADDDIKTLALTQNRLQHAYHYLWRHVEQPTPAQLQARGFVQALHHMAFDGLQYALPITYVAGLPELTRRLLDAAYDHEDQRFARLHHERLMVEFCLDADALAAAVLPLIGAHVALWDPVCLSITPRGHATVKRIRGFAAEPDSEPASTVA